MHDLATGIAIRNTRNLRERLAVGVLNNGVVELAAANEINVAAFLKRTLRQRCHMRANEGNLEVRIGLFHLGGQTDIARESRGAGEQQQDLILLGELNRLLGGDVVRWSVQQARTFQHSSRIGEPDRVPVGLNLSGSGPARTGSSIKVFERRRIQE